MYILYRGHVCIYMCAMCASICTCKHIHVCMYMFKYLYTRVSGMQHGEMTTVVNNTFQKVN